MAKAGRWLAAEHPEGTRWLDSQWDPGVRLSSGQQVWAGTLGHPDRPAPGDAGLVLETRVRDATGSTVFRARLTLDLDWQAADG